MTVTLKVSSEEEARLLAAAADRGQEVSNYLLALARQEFQIPPAPSQFEGLSVAEALAGQIGTVDSRKQNAGRMSDYARNSEEEFGKIIDEKKAQGNLGRSLILGR